MDALDARGHIADKVARHMDKMARERADIEGSKYLYVQPNIVAANELIDQLADTTPPFRFGIGELDDAMGGVSRGELCYLTGRAHSGKTMLVSTALFRDRTTKVIYFTPDETRALVFARLTSLVHNYDYEVLKARVLAEDYRTIQLIRTVAEEEFPNLRVCDFSLAFPEMTRAMHEAEEQWQAPCEAMVLDYLDLLPGSPDYHGTKKKSTGLKNWIKEHKLSGIGLHQPNRQGTRGMKIGMDELSNAGETEATYVIGVHRKKDRPGADYEEELRHRNTISFTVSKNKRPPCRTGTWDCYMHPTTGLIRSLRIEDTLQPGVTIPSAAAAAALRASKDVIDLDSRRHGA